MTGFSDFVTQVERAVAPLLVGAIDNGEPFAIALETLQWSWKRASVANAREQEMAVKALEHAEQRNILAEKIVRQICTHRDAPKVPAVVIEFLCGPWAQVVAQARIAGGANDSTDGDRAHRRRQRLHRRQSGLSRGVGSCRRGQ